MDDDSKNKLKDVLSAIDPIEYQYVGNDMSDTGFQAQEIGNITIDLGEPVISIGASGQTDTSWYTGGQTISIGAVGSSVNWATANSTDYGKNYIQTEKYRIDLDELAEMMETLKKRLLILTPSFEMHEKYPMLKELYNEYKAMEKLLSGPDVDE